MEPGAISNRRRPVAASISGVRRAVRRGWDFLRGGVVHRAAVGPDFQAEQEATMTAWADYVEWSGLDEARLAEIMDGDERRGG